MGKTITGKSTEGASTLAAAAAPVNETKVTAITSTGTGPLGIGSTITFTLTTDHAVTVTGTPRLSLSNGAHAIFAGMDGSGRPTFTYTVAQGDTATSHLAVTGLDTTGGTINGPQAQMSFALQPHIVVDSRPYSVALADVNGDNRLDLLAVHASSDDVSVRLGNGDGSFSGEMKFGVGDSPRAIAIADLNSDGNIDIIAVNSADNDISVLLGKGDGTFASKVDFGAGTYPNAVTAADVNGDKRLDLIVANGASNNLSVLLGNGDGSFSSKTDYAVGNNPISTAAADLNGDGKLDLVALNGLGGSLSILHGKGDGTFVNATDVAVGRGLGSVIAVDLEGDGDIDLVTANSFDNTVSIRLNNGSGSFAQAGDIPVGASPASVVAADVNGDGKLDLVTGNGGNTNLSVLLGRGDGTFSSNMPILAGVGVTAITAADVNGDGQLDLIAASSGSNRFAVLLNTSTPTLSFDLESIADAAGADTGRAVDATRPDQPIVSLLHDTGFSDSDRITNNAALAVIGEDGATFSYDFGPPQTATGNYNPDAIADGEHTVKVIQTDKAGNASYSTSITFTLDRKAPDAPRVTLTADTGSSNSDRITSNGALTIGGIESGATLSYIVDGGTASATYDPTTLADGAHTVKVIQTDKAGNASAAGEIAFTIDRTPEVTKVTSIASDGSGTLKIGDTINFTLTTDHAVTVTGTPTLVLSNGAHAVYVRTDADGKLVFAYTVAAGDADISDLAVTGVDTTSGTIDGPGGQLSFTAQPSVGVGGRPFDIVVADVSGDGKLDIITANYDDDTVSVRLGDGHGGFSAGVNLMTSNGPSAVAVADFNGDGKLDIVVVGDADASGGGSVFFGNGDGSFSVRTKLALAGYEGDVVIADINNDGRPDLLAGGGPGTLQVRLGDGKGGFVEQPETVFAKSLEHLAIADFNNDGNADVVATVFTSDKLHVLLGDGKGGFEDARLFATFSNQTSVAAADVNGDGAVDLLSATSTKDYILVLLGDGTGGFQAAVPVTVGSVTSEFAVADINGDGKLDIASVDSVNDTVNVMFGDGAGGFTAGGGFKVGRLTASIAVQDVDGDGKLDILTTNRVNGGSVSVLLNTSITAMPFTDSGISAVAGADTGRAVDATRPDAPTVGLTSDTGASDADRITSNAALDIGGKETDATLSYSIDGGAYSETYDPTLLADGWHTVSVRQADKAGNLSDVTDITFRLDRSAAAPVVTLTADTGSANSDRITSNGALTLGGIEAGATVSYVVDVGAASATYDPTKLADGMHTVSIIQTDKAGNVSAAREITFELDRTPEVTKVTSITSDGSGTLKIGDTITFTLTTNHMVTVTGTPKLVLSNGAYAVFSGIDSSGYPKFTYTVAAGNADTADLVVTGLDTASGTISGPAGALGLGAQSIVPVDRFPQDIATADINGDGILDMVVANFSRGFMSVRLGDGNGGFSNGSDVPVVLNPRALSLADINGDGKIDLVTATASGLVSVLLGDGAGGFANRKDYTAGQFGDSVATADMNNDGHLDILVGNYADDTVSVLLADGAGGFLKQTVLKTNGTPDDIAVGDINSDGKLDLLVANFNGGDVSVLLGNGAGGFSTQSPVTLSDGVNALTLADINDDGDLDLLVTNYLNDTVSVFLGDGAGAFSKKGDVAVSRNPNALAVADINGDGKLDLVTANGLANTVSVLLGDGLGGFSGKTDFAVGGRPSAISIADVNGDGKLDVMVTNYTDNTVSVLLNTSTTGLSFDSMGLAGVTGADTGRAVDANRPDKPVVSLLHDTGLSGSDYITNDATLAVTGEDGATFSYMGYYQTAWGNYDPDALTDGSHTFYVKQTDKAGNESDVTTISFTLDRKAPNAPVVTLTTDTGASGTDRITSNGVLDIGGVENGATLSYVVDGGLASSTYDPSALADGEHTVQVMQTDKAGNVSTAASMTFTLDRSVAVPVVSLTSDTGVSGTDRITSSGVLNVAGVENGATLSYVVDGGTASASYDPTALADGPHTVQVIQTDKAGNVSTAGSITFTLDRSVAAPVVSLTNDTGSSGADRITSNGALTIAGVEDGATLSYVVDGGQPSGSYDPAALADGEHTVEVVQTDKAGNVSTAGSITFTLDRSVATPVVSLASDTGISAADRITRDGALDIGGVEQGATLSYSVDGGAPSANYDPTALADGAHTVKVIQRDKAGNVSAARTLTFTLDRSAAAPVLTLADDTGASGTDRITSNGVLDIGGVEQGATLSYVVDGGAASSSYDPTSLVDGTHTVEVIQTDKAGNISSAGTVTFTLDRSVATPVVSLSGDTGTSNSDGITSNGALDIGGVEQGSTLSYVIDGGKATGTYDPSALADGAHTVEVIQTDKAGNVSLAGTVTFTLDRTAAAPVVGLASDTGISGADRITSDGALDIGGLEQGAVLSYVVDGGAASDSYDPTSLADGEHTVDVFQTDKAGNVSIAGTITFTLDRNVAAPVITLVEDTGTSDSDGITNNGALSIIHEAGAALSYIVDGGPASDSYDPTALVDGDHTVEVIQTDKAGNVSVAGSISFSLDRIVTAPVLALTLDTGPSNTDRVTSNAALTVSGIEADATLRYRVDAGPLSATYDPPSLTFGMHKVEVIQTDKAGNVSIAGSIAFTLAPDPVPANQAPVLVRALDDQTAEQNSVMVFTVPADAFIDGDRDVLRYSALLSGGEALPAWLHFDAATRTFSGVPGPDDVGLVSVMVTASDGQASASDVFDILVTTGGGGANGIGLSASTVAENVEAGTVVGTLSVTGDLDPQTLTLRDNPENAFAIVDGKLVVADGAALDFEARDSYTITIDAVDDNGAVSEESFTIEITDVAEVIKGTRKADTLVGDRGADIIRGLRSNDVLRGMDGDDRLAGGRGNDRLQGGDGADTFVFGSGHDSVRDFHVDQGDIIDLRQAAGIENFRDLRMHHVTETDRGLVITDDAGSTMLLRHVEMADIRVDSFHF